MSAGPDMGWVLASDDEVRQRLTSELARVDPGDPYNVFSLSPDAGADQIRAAYLAATKVYHPNRFARRDQTIRRLANELFLIINRSYQQLTALPSTRNSQLLRNTTKKVPILAGAPRPTRASQTPPVPTTVAFKPADPAPTPTPVPASRPAPPSRPPGQPLIPDPPSQAVGSTPITDRARRTTDGRALSPGRAGLERALDQRRRARDRKGTPMSGVPATPPSRVPTPPPTPPATPVSEVVDRVVEREDRRNEQFKSGQTMLRQGKFSAAKEVFRQLAIESPSTKKFRVYMHYAWGRELQAARRDDDARAEYNRALNLEPDFEPALKQVASLAAEAPKPPTGGGILSRFFPKS